MMINREENDVEMLVLIISAIISGGGLSVLLSVTGRNPGWLLVVYIVVCLAITVMVTSYMREWRIKRDKFS